jgi:hypothetical protein
MPIHPKNGIEISSEMELQTGLLELQKCHQEMEAIIFPSDIT